MPDPVRFDHYEVLTRDDGSLYELGRGAMGITYKAFDANLRIPVALKVINGNYLESEVARQRFVREARSAAKLRHRNVASVFHLGTGDGAYFYAMEFIDGETVESLIKRQGALPPALALQIADQVARALNAAQQHGLVHRDIKPANLMLVKEDDELVVKVIDFGLAKTAVPGSAEDLVTMSMGGFVGTPHFASPEQLEEREIDVRSDIYSLGVTLWYMLAGHAPFGGSLAQVMSQHLSKPPPIEKLHGLPEPVTALLTRMLEKDPGFRPQTPAELRQEIERVIASLHDSPAANARIIPDEQEDFATIVATHSPAEHTGGTHFEPGNTLAGRYQIISSLGETNAGRIFHAEDLAAEREVRLVVLHRDQTEDSNTYTQLEREVDKLSKVQHPNLLQVYGLETTDRTSFLVIEWTESFSLLELLRARRELHADEVLKFLPQAADAIDAGINAGLKRLDLVLHQIHLHFPGLGDNRDAVLHAAVETWPPFTLKINPLSLAKELSASETWAGGQTIVGGAVPRGATENEPQTRYIQQLAAIVYELLGGTLSPLALSGVPPRYTPLANLSEQGNEVLKTGLDPHRSFSSAGEFYRALAGLEQLTISRPTSTAAPASTRAPRTPPPVAQPQPQVGPPLPPAMPPRTTAFPVKFVGGFATVLAIGAAVYFATKPVGGVQGGDPTPEPEPPSLTANQNTETETPPTTETPERPPLPPEITEQPPVMSRTEMLKSAVTKVEEQEEAEAWPEAIAEWLTIAKEYPESEVGKVRLEMLLERLRGRPKGFAPEEFRAVRSNLDEAAKLGLVSAMLILGENLRTIDPEESFRWYSAAAERGHVGALTQMGLMLSNGLGTEKDLNRALECFREGAEKGHAAAIFALAECYLHGKNVPKDEKRAVELLKEAVEKGDKFAMDLLGTCYHRGVGVEKNFKEAARLFQMAIDAGNLTSLGNLGVLYINGEGVEANPQKAVSLVQKGANEGDAYCMYLYARCYEVGMGVDRNKLQAMTWYKKGAEAGHPGAREWCKANNVEFGIR